MKQYFVTTYRYREGLDEGDLRELTKRFFEIGVSPGVIAHYERLDGKGGFTIAETDGVEQDKAYEVVLRYSPWLDFETFPVTSMEDALPVITKVYG